MDPAWLGSSTCETKAVPTPWWPPAGRPGDQASSCRACAQVLRASPWGSCPAQPVAWLRGFLRSLDPVRRPAHVLTNVGADRLSPAACEDPTRLAREPAFKCVFPPPRRPRACSREAVSGQQPWEDASEADSATAWRLRSPLFPVGAGWAGHELLTVTLCGEGARQT